MSISLLIGAVVLLFGAETLPAQDLFVSGSGAPAANDQYKEVGSIDGKPHFQLNGDSTAYEIAWSNAQSRWLLYNTFNGFTYYFSPYDTPLPPRSADAWGEDKGGSPPPTLSGPRTSGPLGGTYTVGGAVPDFLTISGAVDSLNAGGIFDDVTFSIRTGTYDEQVTIEDYTKYGGGSDVVKFTASGATVTWNYTGVAGAADNYFANVNGSSYITFENITFESTAVGLYGRMIVTQIGSNRILIDNCRFLGISTGSGNDATSVQSIAGTTNLTIRNSEFVGNHFGILINGGSNLQIADNTFRDHFRAVEGIGQVGVVVSGNDINNVTNGITLSSVSGSVISSNRIDSAATGMGIVGATSPSADGELVINNFCVATAYCLAIANSDSVFAYNNSFIATGPAATANLAAIRITDASAVRIVNNLLGRISGGNFMYEDTSPTGIAYSDYNNFWYGSLGFELVVGGTPYVDQGSYKAATGFDGNSTNVAISYANVANADMHLTGAHDLDPNVKGVGLSELTTDFDGDARSNAFPYKGADERVSFGYGFDVDLTVLLEGNHSGAGAMTTALNSSGNLETSARQQPYGGAPWSFGGTDDVPVGFFASNATVVDWVYVVLYAGTLPGVLSYETAAVGLLLSDGTVVDPKTPGDPLTFVPPSGLGSYHVAIFHRNHLAAISTSPLTYNPPGTISASYDFTDAMAKAHGTKPMKDLGGGYFGLYAGNASTDGQVTATDFNAWLADTKSSATGYLLTDFNLDGQVTVSDFNVWLANTKAAASSQVP